MGIREEENTEIGNAPSNPRGPSQGTFKAYVSKFGYSNSSAPVQLAESDPTDRSGLLASPSTGVKRKRPQKTDLLRSPTRDTSQSPRDRRKRIPSSCGRKIPSDSPGSLATPIVSNLRDSLRPNLTLVLIGLNPGITTAKFGHPYSHPSNGFWKILHTSGVTPVQHRPQDHPLLPDLYGIGNTNICARPSRLGSELTKAELLEGANVLDEKIAFYRPEAACISGKGVWEAMWSFKTGKKKMLKVDGFRYGWQDEKLWLGRIVEAETGEVRWKGSRTFVAPSTSGLNAGMSPAEKEEAWKPIGEWMRVQRQIKENNKETSAPHQR